MVFRDRWVPSYFVILEISGDGENDRMILSCQVSYTVTSSSGDYVPRVSLTRTAYTGREADLRLGEDLSGWQAVLAEGTTSHYNFWNPSTGQGILISDFGCLPLSGLTEPPALCLCGLCPGRKRRLGQHRGRSADHPPGSPRGKLGDALGQLKPTPSPN